MELLSYNEARELIQDGDIVFFEGDKTSPVHFSIMTFTESRFFHVSIAFWVGRGENKRCLLVEAHGNSRRRIVPLSFYEHHRMVIVKPPLPWDTVEDEAFKRIGKEKYGYGTALYIGIREIFLKYFDIKLPVGDFPREVCSEYVAKVYRLPETMISPQRLYEMLVIK